MLPDDLQKGVRVFLQLALADPVERQQTFPVPGVIAAHLPQGAVVEDCIGGKVRLVGQCLPFSPQGFEQLLVKGVRLGIPPCSGSCSEKGPARRIP